MWISIIQAHISTLDTDVENKTKKNVEKGFNTEASMIWIKVERNYQLGHLSSIRLFYADSRKKHEAQKKMDHIFLLLTPQKTNFLLLWNL